MPTKVEITFTASNKISKIESEGLTPEGLVALALEIEEDPGWVLSPADKESNQSTTHTVEI